MDSKFYDCLLSLLDLSSKKKYEEVKQLLQSSTDFQFGPSVSKGVIAEYFIAELLVGNNSWAEVTSFKGDDGIDIFEYTRNEYIRSKCYQIKNQSNPLSKTSVEAEIATFKQSKYRKLPYYILSISGFTFEKNTFNYPNVYLLDFEYVISLIDNYSSKLNTDPGSTYFLYDESFITKFDEFLKYKHQISRDDFYDYLPDSIAKWCTKVRNDRKNGKLNIKKVQLLNSIKFYWSHNNYIWDKTSFEFKKIYEKYSSTFDYTTSQQKSWIKRQLNDYINGILPTNRLKKLQSINLINEWLLNI